MVHLMTNQTAGESPSFRLGATLNLVNIHASVPILVNTCIYFRSLFQPGRDEISQRRSQFMLWNENNKLCRHMDASSFELM